VICISGFLQSSLIVDAFSAPKGNGDQLSGLQQDVAVIKETTTLHLEAQKESLQKDLQSLQSKIEQQDKRIADINASTDRLSIVLTGFATLITVLFAGAGVAAWYSAGAKAREAVEEWIEKRKAELIQDVKTAIGTVQADATKARQEIQAHSDAVAAEAKSVNKQLQANLASATPPMVTPAQIEALDQQEKRLKQKPESEYTFNDWESRAFTAYASKQFDLAANYFLQASQAADATQVQIAHSLFARGVMLGEMNRNEEALVAYEQAIDRYGQITGSAFHDRLAMAMVNKGVTLGQLNRWNEAIVTYEHVITRFREANEPALQYQVAMAMFNKGVAHGRLGRSVEAIATYEQFINRYGDAAEPALQAQVARAMVNKGITFSALNENEKAMTIYDQVISRYGEAAESELQAQVAKAMVQKGFLFVKRNRHNDSITIFDQVLTRYGEVREIVVREQVARAMVQKGIILGELKRYEDSMVVFDQVSAKFGGAKESSLSVQVAMAMFNKGVTLSRLDRHEEAIVAYEQVINRYGEATEPALRAHMVKAMVNKASTLGRLSRRDEAMVVYEQVINRYGEATEPILCESVSGSINGVGFSLLLKAKKDWDEGKARAQYLADAQINFKNALQKYPQNAFAIGNLSYVYFLSGRRDEASETLCQALELGGEELYRETIKDTESNRVPDDAAFRELLDKIWNEVKLKKPQ